MAALKINDWHVRLTLPNYKDKSHLGKTIDFFCDFASHLLIYSTFGLCYIPGNMLGLG